MPSRTPRLSAAEARAMGAERSPAGRQAVLPPISEKVFMAQVVALAARRGFRVWHDTATNTPRRCAACGAVRSTPRNPSGLPDLILIRRPRVVWVELKSDRGKVSDDQQAWLDDLRACGQEVYVFHPADWPEVEKVLR